ncbi:MAG: ABC transporter permease [Planctomycetota bacterium]
MGNIGAMAKRELGAYFLSPIAYVTLAIFLFASGMGFGLGVFGPGEEASLRALFDPWMVMILCFVLPMLTMRLVSDELRSGTIETLMTAPISETQIVFGKFVGAFFFYLVLLVTLLIYPLLLNMYGTVDVKLLSCHYLGLLLLGGLYIATGLFFSACTKHQVVAVLFSFALLALMTFAFQALAGLDPLEGWPRVVLQQLSIRTHFHDFVRGMLDTNHVVFFVTTTALFLFLTVKRLEMRRWQ